MILNLSPFLKDASSAAIYGTRGANGVIIITTKHGRAGEKANVNISLRTGVTTGNNQYDMLNTKNMANFCFWSQERRITPGPTGLIHSMEAVQHQ